MTEACKCPFSSHNVAAWVNVMQADRFDLLKA